MVKPDADQGVALYDRLIRRLEKALDQNQQQDLDQEVSVADLTQGQMALIRAYRNKDVAWLRGWHAAVDELKVSEVSEKTPLCEAVASGASIGVCCALCGAALKLHAGEPLPACGECGARIYRAPPSR